MDGHDASRRDILALMAALPLVAAPRAVMAQATSTSPVKVDTRGLTPKIRFEHVIGGYLTELNGKYKLRITELTIEPGGHVGEHNHVGPGIRLMSIGEKTYGLTAKTPNPRGGALILESCDTAH